MLPVCLADAALPSSLSLSLGPHLQRRDCGLGLAGAAGQIGGVPPRAPGALGRPVSGGGDGAV